MSKKTHNIKTHILYLCPKCGGIKIADRIQNDPEDSIFVRTECVDCEDIRFTGYFMHYFGINGYLWDEERNNSQN